MQVTGVDYTQSFLLAATDTSTRIMIVITLCHKEEGWVAKISDAEASFLHPDMPVEVFIEWSKGIVDLGIFMEEFWEEYLLPLGKLMYGNVEVDL